MMEILGREWLAYHFYHHQDRGLLLRELILPLAAEVCGAHAERFFYVRYDLGGPHIRLRFEVPQGTDAAALDALIGERAEVFFARFPSTSSRSAEEISELNRRIVASDPYEVDMRVLPDNHWERAIYRPEQARYGGGELLDRTHDLFMASSLAAGELLKRSAGLKETQILPKKMILLAKVAVALAQDDLELEGLLTYGPRWWPGLEALGPKIEKRFAVAPELYLELWRRALEPAGDDAPAIRHVQATASRLRRHIDEVRAKEGMAEAQVSYGIASQVHMTANRLELDNANEVLALGLLARAHQLKGRTPAFEPDARQGDRDLALAALLPSSAATTASSRQGL